MLKHLTIQNYALIKKLSLGFTPDFTVVTGETGAGKSILLGALGLLLGQRADPNVLMDKQKKCVVEGSFNVSRLTLQDFFTANDLDYEDLSILRREIIPSGRSRAFINDSPVKLEVLKKLGAFLVDIHSQHQTLMLNNSPFQLEVLDGFVNQPDYIHHYRSVFSEYERNRRQLAQLIQKNTSVKQDEDYIRFQLNELESAGLNAEATADLIEREKFLSNAEEIILEISKSNQLLSENEPSLTDQITEVVNSLSRIAGFFQPAQQLLERLKNMQIELKDIASEIAFSQSGISFNADEFQEVSDKLDNVYRLQQKHGVQSVEALIDIRDDYAEQLQQSVSLTEEIESLSEENVKIKKEVERLGLKLHQNRVKHAVLFEKSIAKILKQLGMKDAVFTVEINNTGNYSENGCDQVRFLFNANKGGTPNDIPRIASGGELSRLMLAIKSLVHQKNLLPTVIFDEIDAGISGEIAARVGNILKQMSMKHQLIVISHLPQIASKAATHLLASKYVEGEFTHSQISLLDTDGRVDEIAKMMSDEKVSPAAIETAKELLKQAP